jgi:tetratricopeptide (TPR) repeat protein
LKYLLPFPLLLLGYLGALSAQVGPLSEQAVYQKALNLYQQGQYAQAQWRFDQVRGAEASYDRQTRANATYYAARCAMKLYNGDASDRVERFAELYPGNARGNQLFLHYANNRMALKSYRRASQYYRMVNPQVLTASQQAEYTFKLGYSLLQQDSIEAARQQFFALKDGPSAYAGSARYYYAHLLYADSNYRQALQNFLPLQDDPNFGGLVPYYLAHIYYRLNNYDQLIEVGQALLKKATPSRIPEIAKLIADAHYEKGQYPEVVRYLKLYDEKGGAMRVKINFQAGYALYQMGEYRQALGYFNKITGGPKKLRQNTYYHLADCYLKIGKKQEARNAFKAATEYDQIPGLREDAFFQYAKLSYELNDPFRDALATLQAFLDAFPQSEHRREVQALLADMYVSSRNYTKALEAIEAAGLQNAQMQALYQKIAFYRANALYKNGQYAAALQHYRQSQDYPRSNRFVLLSQYWIGEALYQLEKLAKARAAWQKFQTSPGAALLGNLFNRSFYNTAYTYYQEQDYAPAAEDYRRFVNNTDQESDRRADAYLRLGDCYFRTGGYLIAARFYKKAIAAEVRQGDYALYQRAKCLGLAGETEKKVALLRRMKQDFPESSLLQDAAYEVALTYLRSDQYPQALQALKQFKQQFSQSSRIAQASLQEGLIYSNMDQNNQAIQRYKKVVQQHPGTDAALEAVRLAEIAYKRENKVDAYLDWVAQVDFIDYDRSKLDSTAFNAALERYSMNQWKPALDQFAGYLKRFKNGLFRTKAAYYAAQAAENLDKQPQALNYYKMLSEMPRHDYSLKAYQKLAQARFKDSAFAKARQYYRQIEEMEPLPPDLRRARLGILKTSARLGDRPETLRYARLLRQKEDLSSPEYRLVLKESAQALAAQGQLDSSLTVYRQLSDTAKGAAQAEAYYQTARVLYQKKAYKASNEEINLLIENLPSYKEWKLRGLLLMARNFFRLGDIFQANYIIDFLLKEDYSPALNQKVKDLQGEIEAAEKQALKAKKDLMQKQSDSGAVRASEELRLIDAPPDSTAGDSLPPQTENAPR